MSPPDAGRGPSLPWGKRQLARVLQGVFGLAGAPREWYLRLSRCLREHGWEALPCDAACFVLRREGKLCRIICSHVDDLLMTGDEGAWDSFMKIFQLGLRRTTSCGAVSGFDDV